MSNRYVVGLTGGIASGKSVVSGALGTYPDVTVIDADVISREIYDIPEVAQAVAAEFPESVADGAINRRKLRSVFSDAQKTEKLNAITHPAIIETCKRRIEEASGIVLLVVPLLFESGMDKLCDSTVVVRASEPMRIKWLLSRDNIDETMARDVMKRQLDDDERVKKADFVIENDGSISDLEKAADEFLAEIREVARKK